MDPSIRIHLEAVRDLVDLVRTRDRAGFAPIERIITHLISIVNIQERRISYLEEAIKELERR